MERKAYTHEDVEVFIDEYIIYLRKSRAEKPNESVEDTLKRHEKMLQDFATKELGGKIEEHNIYREVVSGETIDERPKMLEVLERMEKGNIKGVLVVEPQRLSRGSLSDCGRIIDTFLYTGTLLCTPYRTYNAHDKYDRKFLEMELVKGNEYLEYTKEILLRGRLTSIQEGKFIGSITPYGYDKEKIKDDKGYKLVINEEEAVNVRMIFDLCLEGVGTSNIANTLNKLGVVSRTKCKWSPAMVRNILTNPTYYGMLTWERSKLITKMKDGSKRKSRTTKQDYILVKGLHEPIVSEDEFTTCQAKITTGKPTPFNELKNPLASLVKCSKCGHIMIRRPYNKAQAKHPKRIHHIDKTALLTLLRAKKEESKLSLNQIRDRLGDVSKDQVNSWFTNNVNKFYTSTKFSEKWYDLKALLNITTDEYDEALTTYKYDEAQPPALICPMSYCDNVSSHLVKVEERILKAVEARISDYKYFIDNYEEVIVKTALDTSKMLEKIDKKLESLEKELKNTRRAYAREEYTFKEYQETKAEIEEELQELEAEKSKLVNTSQAEELQRYKKAVPKLEACIKEYHSINNIEDKNNLLLAIIKEVRYLKEEGGRWNANADFTLEIDFNI